MNENKPPRPEPDGDPLEYIGAVTWGEMMAWRMAWIRLTGQDRAEPPEPDEVAKIVSMTNRTKTLSEANHDE